MAELQERGNAGCAIVVLLGLLAFLHGAQAATIVVGGSTTQWNYPPNNDLTWYDNVWAKNQTFHVGDVLGESHRPWCCAMCMWKSLPGNYCWASVTQLLESLVHVSESKLAGRESETNPRI